MCFSFDVKQPGYRILFQREANATCLEIAISDSEETIESAWDWIRINMLPELENISSPFAKEEWVVKQMNKIVSATITGKLLECIFGSLADKSLLEDGTDDLVHDETIRIASRTFRQCFDIPATERLVNCK